MKTYIYSIFFILIAAMVTPAMALNWVWLGAPPYAYSVDEDQWLYVGVVDEAVWMVGGSTFIQFAPAVGMSPGSIAGSTLSISLGADSATFTLNQDGTYLESNEDGNFSGAYIYKKTDTNTGFVTLIEDGNDGGIVAVTLTFTNSTSGSVSGRSTDINETVQISANFTMQ